MTIRMAISGIARLGFFGWMRLRQEWTINGSRGVAYLLAHRTGCYGVRRLVARRLRPSPFRDRLDPFLRVEALVSAGRVGSAIDLARMHLGSLAAASPRALRRWKLAWALLADLLVIGGRAADGEAVYRRILAVEPDDRSAAWGIENLQRRQATLPPIAPLPIHFFTIVLNGMPLIEHHIAELLKLPFEWHWHIVEGIAELTHDTGWSRAKGGRADASLHRNGLSIDGTSEYLDRLAQTHPDRVTIYRPTGKRSWDGKIEMVRAPLARIREECLLWQIDADEFWTADQIGRMRQRFGEDPSRTAAYFLCHYFIKNLVITTANTYGNHPTYEWLRVWRYRPGDYWATHEPPRLCRPRGDHAIGSDLADINPFVHGETLRDGLVFRHLAYVLPEQLRFKEIYYGYSNAMEEWRDLPEKGPLRLRDHLTWITDGALAEDCRQFSIVPPVTDPDRPSIASVVSAGSSTLFREAHSDIALNSFGNILVAKLDNIGDVLLLSPFLRELRRNAPHARITLAVRDLAYNVVELCPHVDRVVPLTIAPWSEDFATQDRAFVDAIKDKTFDLAVVPRWDVDEFGAGALARRSGARRVVGFSEGASQKKARENAGFDRNYSDAFLKVSVDHTVVQNLALLPFMNASVQSDKLEVWVDDGDTARAAAMLAPCGGGPIVAICPGASHPGKIYPAELLLEILAHLPSSYRFAFLGGSEDRAAAQLLHEALPGRGVMLCGETTLRQAAAVLAQCRAAITMDSALAHFAAATDTPVVVFSMHPRHGGNETLDQSPHRFGPWCAAERRLIVQPDHAWPGCEHGCRWRGTRPHCIGNIDTGAASEMIRDFLAHHLQ